MAEALKDDGQDQIKTHPREEWAVRRGAYAARRDLKVIDDFLQKNPQLSERGKAAVESVREIDRKRLEFFDGKAQAGRFTLTEVEKDDVHQLLKDRMQRLLVIGRIVDGKQ